MLMFAVWALAVQGEGAVEGPAPQPPAPPPALVLRRAPQARPGETAVEGVVVSPLGEAPPPEWARKFNFDVRGEFKRSDVPYLRRRPVDGCKLMAGGSVSPAGVHGVASGPVCSFRF